MYCCSNFSESLDICTDNEGYSSAIKERNGSYTIGLIRSNINLCPWCGKSVNEEMSNHVEDVK